MNIESMNESYAMAFLVTEYNRTHQMAAHIGQDNNKNFCYVFPLIFHLLVAPGYIKLYYIILSYFYTKKGYYIVG